MTTAVLFPEAAEFARLRGELAASGYRDAEHKLLRPGRRVRRRAEQFPEAFDNGTGVILAVMEHVDSSWSRSYRARDIELIVLKDKPLIEGMSRVSQLANYHVEAVGVCDHGELSGKLPMLGRCATCRAVVDFVRDNPGQRIPADLLT